MKKKLVNRGSRKKKYDLPSHLFLGYTMLIFGLVCLFALAAFTLSKLHASNVLGISFLAEENGSTDPQYPDFKGYTNDREGGSTEQDGTPPPPPKPQTNFEHPASSTSGTTITCKRPDGKVIQTTKISCEYIYKYWKQALQNEKTKHSSTSGRLPDMNKIEIRKHKESELENTPEISQNGDDEFVLRQGSVGARTKFPITFDPNTNQLSVSTPNGEKNIAVLPEHAVQNLLDKKIITGLDNGKHEASESVSLTEKNKAPVFEVPGLSNQNLFGFIPVTIHKSVDVSAQTGDVVSETESFGQRLLDIFSF